MAGRPKNFTETELIDSATEVFWQKGYHAASAQDLLQAMGIGQGSFYRTFPKGKKEIYRKSLVRFLNLSIQRFHVGLEDSDDPLVFIETFFRDLVRKTPEKRAKGCYLGNALIEWKNLDEDTAKQATELLNELKKGFEKALRRARRQGLLGSETSTALSALHLLNLWNGINVTLRTDVSGPELEQLVELNLAVLR